MLRSLLLRCYCVTRMLQAGEPTFRRATLVSGLPSPHRANENANRAGLASAEADTLGNYEKVIEAFVSEHFL